MEPEENEGSGSRWHLAAVEEANRLKAFLWTGGITTVGFALIVGGAWLIDHGSLSPGLDVVVRGLVMLGMFCFLVFAIPAIGAGILWGRSVVARRGDSGSGED